MMSKDVTPTTFERACRLLTPVYSPEDIQNVFGVSYTEKQRAALKDIPFSEAVLKACAGTHMLFPGFPMSLLDVRTAFADLFYSKTGGWYANQKFATIQVQPVWHLLCMEPVPGSLGKSWSEQRTLLAPNEEVSSAALVAFATMLHYQSTKHRLFEHRFVRTSDVDSDGYRVSVGNFDADGFCVDFRWVGVRDGLLGLSASRKF